MPEKIRSFIALSLPQEIKNYLTAIIQEFKKIAADVKWVKPENLHLTLKFLGEQEEKRIKKIKEILEVVAGQRKSYALELGGIGGFPKLEYPRVIWIGLSKGTQETLNLVQELEKEISKLGIPQEKKPFATHITLGRVRSALNREKLVACLKDFAIAKEKLNFSAQEIVLYKSTLTAQGPIYEPIHRVTFKNN